jgi:hypothetical protein
MGEAAGRQPPRNQATSEQCRSRGQGRGAMRCSRHGCGKRWWWRHCKNHHSRYDFRRRGFYDYRAIIKVTTVVASGHRRPSEVVAQHTKGRHSSPKKIHNSPVRWHNRGRVGVGGRHLGFGSSGSEKKLSSNYHVGDRCATEYWVDCIA